MTSSLRDPVNLFFQRLSEEYLISSAKFQRDPHNASTAISEKRLKGVLPYLPVGEGGETRIKGLG